MDDIDKTLSRIEKEIKERKNKINKQDYKYFNVFIKSLFRQNLNKIDLFINSISKSFLN